MLSKKQVAAEPQTERETLSAESRARLSRRILGHYAPLLKGNGVEVETLALQSFEADLLTLRGRASLDLRVRVERSVVPGKIPSASLIHTPAHQVPRLEEEVGRLVRSPDFRLGVAQLVLNRPDQGFQPQGPYVMPIPSARVELVAHEGCHTCHHTGGVTCPVCTGAQKVRCTGCDGTRLTRCPDCHGARVFTTPQGSLSCQRCQGQGKVTCLTCKGQGDLSCKSCAGHGSFRCEDCASMGWKSIILSALLEVHGSFTLDLPKGLPVPLMNRILGRLKKASDRAVHIHAWTITPHPEAVQVVGADPYHMSLPYTLTAPLARYVLPVRGGRIKGTAFGWDMGLLDPPLVLEALLKKPLDQLKALALRHSANGASLEALKRVRLIREAFEFSKMIGTQKTFLRLRKRYPFGIRADRLADLVRNTETLLARQARQAKFWAWVKYGGGALVLLTLFALIGRTVG